MDPTTLSWRLRVAEAERLLKARQAEHANQCRRHTQLASELSAIEAAQAASELEAADLGQRRAVLRHSIQQEHSAISKARAALDEQEQAAAALAQQHRCLERSLNMLRQLCGNERAQAGAFGGLVEEHMDKKGRRGAVLEAQLTEAQARLERVSQQQQSEGLETRLQQLREQAQSLQQEAQMLHASLAASKEANARLASEVGEAERAQAQELQDLEARLAVLREELFGRNRQQSVNEARLQHLRRKADGLAAQRQQLDNSINHASATVDQMASSLCGF